MSKKIILFFIAVFVSLLTIGGAYTVMSGKEFGEDFITLVMLNFPVCVLIGCVDYLTVSRINRRLPTTKSLTVITLNIVVTSALCFGMIVVLNLLLSDIPLSVTMRNALCSLPWNLIIVMMIEAQYYSRQREIAAKEKAVFQLAMLKQQLNPHFLFNSLNTLASLAYTDPQSTNRFAKNLSSVYRYLLDTQNTSLVSIDKEMSFVGKYLELEKIRFGKSLNITVDSTHCKHEAHIIPTGIQLLVENAIKHNVCSEKSPLNISIRILPHCVEVSNNLNPRTSVPSYGIGLKNLSQQYRMHSRDIEYVADPDRFTVRLPLIDQHNCNSAALKMASGGRFLAGAEQGNGRHGHRPSACGGTETTH